MATLPPHANDGKTTFIYALIDPNTQQIRYIGKSNDPTMRLYRHLREKQHTYKNMWIKSLKDKGLTPEIQIIEEVLIEQWQERERYWIAFYRAQGLDIANGTDGGDGVHGRKRTPEEKARISQSLIGNQRGKGYRPTPEQQLRKSAAMKGHAVSAETAEKIAASKRGKPRSPETIEKVRLALTGRKLSEERKAKMRKPPVIKVAKQEKIKIVYSDERRAAMSERAKALGYKPPSRKGISLSPESLAKAKATRLAKNQEEIQAKSIMGNAIRADYQAGMKCSQIMRKYEISQTQAWRVMKGEAWL